MTAAYLILTLVYILIAGPGIIVAVACFKNLYLPERLLIGNVLGISLFIFVCYILNSVSPTLIMGYLFCAYLSAIILAKHSMSKKIDKASPTALLDKSDKTIIVALIVLLVITYISRLIPLYFAEFPLGWDPTFHLILAKKILLNKTLPVDWRPFESIGLNYPLGSHILVTGLSILSGQTLQQSFKICFPIMAVLTASVIYLLGLSLFGDRKLGLAAAFSYSFLNNCGSLGYYRWGGLPNMMGMLFLISALWAITSLNKLYSFILGGFFLASIYLTHHHCMASTFLILAACILGGLLKIVTSYADTSQHEFTPLHPESPGLQTGDEGQIKIKSSGKPRPVTKPFCNGTRSLGRGVTGFTKRLFLALLLSLLITSFYLPAYLSAILKTKNQTAVFAYAEEPISPIGFVQNLGPMFLLLVLAGLFMLPNKKLNKNLLSWWIISLATAFVFLEYIYGFLAVRIYGVHLNAFSAHRFLTDVVYPLSFISGYGILGILSKAKSKWRQVAILIGIIASFYSIIILRKQCISNIGYLEKEALFWIRDNTPENAFIIDNSFWMPYISWREGTKTPLPISEPLFSYSVLRKKSLAEADTKTIIAWAKKNKRPVYLCLYEGRIRYPSAPFRRVFKNNWLEIYKLVE